MRLDEPLAIEEIGYKLHDMGNSTSGTTDKLDDFVDVDISFVNLRTFSTGSRGPVEEVLIQIPRNGPVSGKVVEVISS